MGFLIYGVVMAAGACAALQAPLNCLLKSHLNSLLFGALIVCLLQTFAFVFLITFMRQRLPSLVELKSVPWYAYASIVLGGAVLLASLSLPQKVGAGVYNGLAFTVALIISLALDHFGVFGLQQHPLNAGRAIGALLMGAGILLISVF